MGIIASISPELINALAGSVTAVVAIAAAWYARKEYRWNQAQHKRELAWKFLARLREELPLRLCTIFLDWERRKIEVPESYQRFFAPEETFVHTFEAMNRALNPQSGLLPDGRALPEFRFSWQEVLYRDCFDQFFDYFTEVHSALKANWLDPADLKPLQYWIEKLLLDHRETMEPFCGSYYPHAMVALDEIAAQLNPKWEETASKFRRRSWEEGRPVRSTLKRVTAVKADITFEITRREGKRAWGTLSWPDKGLSTRAVSGQSDHDAIPLGMWEAPRHLLLDREPESGFCDGIGGKGHCWFQAFVDAHGRKQVGIHPDGGAVGATFGCIGISDRDTKPWYDAFFAVGRGQSVSVEVKEGIPLAAAPNEATLSQQRGMAGEGISPLRS